MPGFNLSNNAENGVKFGGRFQIASKKWEDTQFEMETHYVFAEFNPGSPNNLNRPNVKASYGWGMRVRDHGSQVGMIWEAGYVQFDNRVSKTQRGNGKILLGIFREFKRK